MQAMPFGGLGGMNMLYGQPGGFGQFGIQSVRFSQAYLSKVEYKEQGMDPMQQQQQQQQQSMQQRQMMMSMMGGGQMNPYGQGQGMQGYGGGGSSCCCVVS
jgi:hypothetical protein